MVAKPARRLPKATWKGGAEADKEKADEKSPHKQDHGKQKHHKDKDKIDGKSSHKQDHGKQRHQKDKDDKSPHKQDHGMQKHQKDAQKVEETDQNDNAIQIDEFTLLARGVKNLKVDDSSGHPAEAKMLLIGSWADEPLESDEPDE